MGFLVGLAVVLLGIIVIQNASHYDTKPFKFQERPALVGSLAPSNKFDNAKLLFKGVLHGPESIVYHEDALYVTDHSGIVKIVKDKIVKKLPICPNKVCGRPLGIRHFKDESFIVADSYLGIVLADMESGKFEVLLPASTLVDGKSINFADDFDYVDEDTIIFSDASEWDLSTFSNSMLEMRGDGRLLSFNLKTKQVKALAEGFYFSNGIQLHHDKESVLVSETGAARVTRIFFAGDKQGFREIFADNLPCLPDNIRSNLRGTFFVACAIPRLPNAFSLMDFLAPYPSLRKLILQIIPGSQSVNFFTGAAPNYGIFLELDAQGKIINSWHDTKGTVKLISQVTETPDAIYIGSYSHEFLAKIDK
ncbi:hypothetical protein FO519_000979 [Halicephalobus sp. NKZ332]|nr:hypothetical protein FO519_000979 [Halicephalobus sp. NKZ332]